MIFWRKGGSGGGVEQSRRVYMSPFKSSWLLVSIVGGVMGFVAGYVTPFVVPFVYGLLAWPFARENVWV